MPSESNSQPKKTRKPREIVPGMAIRVARSVRIIEFLERLRVPSGIGQGEPLVLEPFQKELIRETYDKVDETGRRKIRRAIWSVARKNGKSALAAGLVLVHLLGPEAKRNGEVYSCASDREQAANIYKMASQMVRLDHELDAMCKCLDTTKRIVVYELGSFFQSLAADSRRLHGFNPHFVIYDELAQAKNRELWDVMSTSFGAQPEGLLLAISTQSSDPEHIMSELVDDAYAQMRGELDDETFFGKVYEVPASLDWRDEANWKLANPALGVFKDINHMRSLAGKAMRSPSAEAAFRALELNQRVDAIEGLVTSADWRACQVEFGLEDMRGYPLYCGLDLSGRQDLTAFVMCWYLGNGRAAIKPFFWTPKEELADRAKRDGGKYVEWEKRGHMRTTAGRVVSFKAVVQMVAKLIEGHDLRSIAYDKWRINDFKAEMERADIPPESWPLLEFGQSFKDMSPAVEKLESMVIDHSLQHDGNPVLTYCMGNVRVIKDVSDNRRFDKRKKNRRIDGAVAAAMAIRAMDIAEKIEVEAPSIYEKRGVFVL